MSLAVLGFEAFPDLATHTLTIPSGTDGIVIYQCTQGWANPINQKVVSIGGQLLTQHGTNTNNSSYSNLLNIMDTTAFLARTDDDMVWSDPAALDPDVGVVYVSGNPAINEIISPSSNSEILSVAPNGSNILGLIGAAIRCIFGGIVTNDVPPMSALYARFANNHSRCGAYRVGSDGATLGVQYSVTSCTGLVGSYIPSAFGVYDAGHVQPSDDGGSGMIRRRRGYEDAGGYVGWNS